MIALEVLLGAATLGGLYALIAMGLTLQFGVARILNLAHGEFLIGSAFLSFVLVTSAGWSPLWALLLSVPLGLAVQVLVYRFLLTPLAKRAPTQEALEMDSVLVTFGLLFVVQGIALVLFGGGYQSYSYLSTPVDVFGATVAANRLLACIFALALCAVFYLAIERTRWGSTLRAVSVAPRFAPLVGINTRQTAMLAFGIGGGMVAASGVLIGMFLPFSATMGIAFTLKALVIVIMGGVGNLLGCVLAGMLLGLTETLVARFVDPGLTLASTFALFLMVLLISPSGIFSKAAR